MSAVFKVHAPYPPVPPFVWPEEGVRTWQPSESYVFPGCTGLAGCACSCTVGVRTVGSGVYGCDCKGHDAKRAELGSQA